MCKIGQYDRCRFTGCEWKKGFGKHCEIRELKITYRPMEDFTPLWGNNRKKKGKVVKEEKKYTEIKTEPKQQPKTKPVEIDYTKIGTQKQEDWITKIKTI